MTNPHDVRRVVAHTAMYLLGGLLIGVGIGAGVDALIGRASLVAGRIAAGIAALSIIVVAARRWGRGLAQLTGRAPERAGRMSAIFVAVPMIAAGALLSAIEPAAVARGASAGLSIHAVYTLLFVSTTLVIASLGSFGLGFGLQDRPLGTRLALRAGPAAAGGFLAVALLMYAIGWRVGAPGAGERATMVVVTLIGITVAAVVSGATIGRMLTVR